MDLSHVKQFFSVFFINFGLCHLQSHQSAWPFQKPVDKSEAPDYYDHIRFPMGRSLKMPIKPFSPVVKQSSSMNWNILHTKSIVLPGQKQKFLLRKMALPYHYKCLFGFVEAKTDDQQEYFKNYSSSRGDPIVIIVCACA